jgi:hypothetical protein
MKEGYLAIYSIYAAETSEREALWHAPDLMRYSIQ